MPCGRASGSSKKLNEPPVVTRPMRLPKSSVNQRAPSGPSAIPYGDRSLPGGEPGTGGRSYRVSAPLLEMRPTSSPPNVVNDTPPSGPATSRLGDRPSSHSA